MLPTRDPFDHPPAGPGDMQVSPGDRCAGSGDARSGPNDPRAALPVATRHGRLGETLAAAYLELAGYRLLARNRRCGPWEVDLIAQRGEVVAFVEVRLRSSRSHGRPEASVGWRKRANLARAARGLLGELVPGCRCRVRLDVIAVELEGSGLRVRHLPGWSAPTPLD